MERFYSLLPEHSEAKLGAIGYDHTGRSADT